MKNYFKRFLPSGTCPPRKPLHKIMWSSVGAFLGIALIHWISVLNLGLGRQSLFLVGSFGASAVLVYGAPLAEFSQPRNLIGGHVLSALIGVSIVMLLGVSHWLAAPLAVSLAILMMHLTRTLHPPGGATALIAVIGGDQVHALGFSYVVSPILLGAIVMLIVALFINNLSSNPKRHYPVYWI